MTGVRSVLRRGPLPSRFAKFASHPTERGWEETVQVQGAQIYGCIMEFRRYLVNRETLARR